jgi:hypothetical protein
MLPGPRAGRAGGSAEAMAAYQILEQASKLYAVSESLNDLAQHDAQVAEALRLLANSVRQSATLLEVMVAVKLTPDADVEKASN